MLKKKICHLILVFLILSLQAQAEEAAAATDSGFKFYGAASTVFPVFVGAGLGVIYKNTFDLRLSYGLTPEPYYKVIGEVAASQGDNDAYKDVISAAFKNNSLIKIDTDFYFNSPESGWLVGGSYAILKSNGQAEIDRVLAAANGKDYTTLKNLLNAAGKSTQIDMDSNLNILEIHFGYNWNPYTNLILSTTVGVAKIIESEVSLKTGLPNFEASQIGNNLMRQSESDLEAIIKDYGVSPTLGFNLLYTF